MALVREPSLDSQGAFAALPLRLQYSLDSRRRCVPSIALAWLQGRDLTRTSYCDVDRPFLSPRGHLSPCTRLLERARITIQGASDKLSTMFC